MIAEAVVRFMDASPGLPILLLYVAVAGIPVVLLHELGHALAAVRLLGDEVQVSVGSTGELARLRLGQISVSLSALSHPGEAAGVAEFDASRATARDVLLIAVAGPAASLLGTVLTAWALSAAAPSGVLHGLLWAATSAGVVGGLNLVPLSLRDRRDAQPIASDGRIALEAARVLRALR